jgi:hypothetical protein
MRVECDIQWSGYTSTTANYFALAFFDFEVHRRNRVCVTEQFRIQNQQELTNEFQVSTSSLILNASYTKVL